MEVISLPNQAKIEVLGENKYQVTLEPLHPGYGVTVGNALRRVLLSSMPGSAVTAAKIRFVNHEFSTIPGVKEDVIQIVLNLKQLRLKCFSSEPVRLLLKVKGERVVTAADIEKSDLVEIVNPALPLATLDNKTAELDIELTVEQGRGYVPVEARETEKLGAGVLAIDAIYTPVRSVFYEVSNVRVGNMTNFDKLSMQIVTDGTLTGPEAINIAAHILVDHFSMLFIDTATQPVVAHNEEDLAAVAAESAEEDGASVGLPTDSDLESANLSARAKNALVKFGVTSLEELRKMSSEQIEQIPGLGKKTISEIMALVDR